MFSSPPNDAIGEWSEAVALCGTSAPFPPGAQSTPHPFLEVTLLAVPVCDAFNPQGISWLTFKSVFLGLTGSAQLPPSFILV